MVPSTGQVVALDELIDDRNAGERVTVLECQAAKGRLDEQFGWPEPGEDEEYDRRMAGITRAENLAADDPAGGLVRVEQEVVQKLRLGEKELRRRKQRRR
jgi:hypothetical protein